MKQNEVRVLVVDDLELSRKMISKILNDDGYSDVIEAADGADALRKIMTAEMSGNPFHIVFCDWNMPGVAGIEVVSTIRSNAKFEKLPFVMVTAESDRKEVMAAIAAGATDYVIKPIRPESVLKKMNRVFKKSA